MARIKEAACRLKKPQMLRSLSKILFCFLGSSFLIKACFQIIGTSSKSHLSHFDAQIAQQDGCASKYFLKVAQAGGQTCDLFLVFHLFFLSKAVT